MYLALAIYACLPQLSLSLFVQTGTTILNGIYDQCGNRQEFECANNSCDPVVAQDNVAGATCRFNDGGKRCLETIVAATGEHSMPDGNKDQGTDKHFYCLLVSNFDTAMIAYETSDCTGQSCFIPDTGSYAMWTIGAQGNCIDIDPAVTVTTVPCLSPGEVTTNSPFRGGFIAGLPVPVGGAAGIPVSYNNTNTCLAPPGWRSTAPETNIPNPPIANISTAVFPPYDNTADGGILEKRQAGAPTAVQALRLSNYVAIYNSALRPWIFQVEDNTIAAYIGTASRYLAVDHIVELETVVAFFTADWTNQLGLSGNQVALMTAFINAQGNIWNNGGAIVGSCTAYQDFRYLLNSVENMRGVDAGINLLKNIVFSTVMSGLLPMTTTRANPHWRTSWTRATATGTLAYLKLIQGGASTFAVRVGQFMDYMVAANTIGVRNDLQVHFQLFIEDLWANAIGYLQSVLEEPAPFFLDD